MRPSNSSKANGVSQVFSPKKGGRKSGDSAKKKDASAVAFVESV